MLSFAHVIILTILFCKLNIILLLNELNQKIIPHLLLSKNRQINFFFTKPVLLMRNIYLAVWNAASNLHISSSIQFFTLCSYQFVRQRILYLQVLFYTIYFNLYQMDIVEKVSFCIVLYLSYLDLCPNYMQ